MDSRLINKIAGTTASKGVDRPDNRSKATGRNADKAQKDDVRLKQACADFEGVLLNFMFQAMKKTLPGDGIFGSSHQKEIYESMFYQEISSKFARDRGVGIGDALYRQLKGEMDRSEKE